MQINYSILVYKYQNLNIVSQMDQDRRGSTSKDKFGMAQADSNEYRMKKRAQDEGKQYMPGIKEDPMDDSSEYPSQYDMHATFPEPQMTKERYQNQQRVQQQVRRTEQDRRKQSGFAQMSIDEDDPNIPEHDRRLNANWKQLRYFIGDRDQSGNEVEKGEGSGFASVRLRLGESLQMQDPMDTGRLYLSKVLQAFNRVQCKLSDEDLTDVLRGLQVFYNDDEASPIVKYREILQAPLNREALCIEGTFPIIKAKDSLRKQTANLQMSIKDVEKEKVAKMQKQLEDQKQVQVSKRLKEAEQVAKGQRKGAVPLNKSQQQKEERERAKFEAQQKQVEKKEQEAREEELKADVKVEMAKFNQQFTKIKNTINRNGGFEKQVAMLDSNRDGQIDLKEFMKIKENLRVNVTPQDVLFLFEYLDRDCSGKISYKEMFDAFNGRVSLTSDVEKQIIANLRATGKYDGISPEQIAWNKRVSGDPNLDSNTFNNVTTDSRFTEDYQRSNGDNAGPRQLVDPEENVKNCRIIAKAFQDNCASFDRLTQAMKSSLPGNEDKVLLADFSKAVAAYVPAGYFSEPQVRFVFNFACEMEQQKTRTDLKLKQDGQFLPINLFKERFFSNRGYEDTKPVFGKKSAFGAGRKGISANPDLLSSPGSPRINEILAGKPAGGSRNAQRAESTLSMEREKRAVEQKEREKHNPMQSIATSFEQKGGAMGTNSEIDDTRSVMSVPLDSIVGGGDPRQKKATARMAEDKAKNSVYSQPNPISQKTLEMLSNKTLNTDLNVFKVEVADAIKEDLKIIGSKRVRNPDSLIDRYGTNGSINFKEFEKIYMLHVHQQIDDHHNIDRVSENKLRGLFNLIGPNRNDTINKPEWVRFIQDYQTASFLDRLKQKAVRGSNRFMTSLKIAFDEVDVHMHRNGQTGLIPLPVVQSIMMEYDLPIDTSDRDELLKKQLLLADEEGDLLVNYKDMLLFVTPTQRSSSSQDIALAALLIQRCWRNFVKKRGDGDEGLMQQLQNVGDTTNALKRGAADFNDVLSPQSNKSNKKKLSREQMVNQKAAMQKRAREERTKLNNLEGKMNAAVSHKDGKTMDRDKKMKREIEGFIKGGLLEELLTKALCYGESLGVCREIQTNFENRPVTKFIFPLLLQFQFNVQGVQPKSLQSLDSMGQVMFLDNQSQLAQFELATKKANPHPMNVGTRPPLKHYAIIDIVCDQRSGRVYTINSNWILEIWNLNQTQNAKEDKNASLAGQQSKFFPEKRIAVCSNEGGKDFISLYYKQTYNNAKPRFLCLQESNQQILLVNTTCVDGSIVFIDPISFSVLKKVTLRYQDYEIPRAVRQAINTLKKLFDVIKQKKGKDMTTIFLELVDRDTEEISIKDFVEYLDGMKVEMPKDKLYKIMRTLDTDGSGTISLDEFLNFFGMVKNEEDEKAKAEEEMLLQDDLWPKWIVRQGKLQQVQNIFANMLHQLENIHNISAEACFEIYDMRDEGAITQEQFKRVIQIFFDEVLEAGDVELLMSLTVTRNDHKIFYREFCKFMDKRLVRTFKNITLKKRVGQEGESESQTIDVMDSKTPLELEMDSPLRKEASLTYILRKAAELQLDLRREFIQGDPLELSVISRTQFWGMLLGMPLGLNEVELDEIFDNDLNFDNCGNVDYTSVLNSDMFVALEKRRIAARVAANAEEYKRKRVRNQSLGNNKRSKRGLTDSLLHGGDNSDDGAADDDDSQGAEDLNEGMELADNRKVVVEDLIYIDDLQVMIYSTVAPRTSTLFVTSLKKTTNDNAPVERDDVKVVELCDLDKYDLAELQAMRTQKVQKEKENKEMLTNHYQLLAKLQGHKNTDPPTICYVPSSGCLMTGEKYQSAFKSTESADDRLKADDPDAIPTQYGTKKNNDSYSQYAKQHNDNNQKCEIIVWNLQRDMVELFSMKPPWNIPFFKKFVAHDASIIDMCYLPKSQLLVSSSADQTIRFWDPATQSYELTDPGNNPHAQMRPGHYKPLLKESTQSNAPFKEVKRIYTGGDTICFALRPLNIEGIVMNEDNPGIKSSVEWVVALKLGKQSPIMTKESKAAQMGFIVGYGVDRVKIEVPARHHDDIVPPYINKQCSDMVTARREKVVQTFAKQLSVHTAAIQKMNAGQSVKIEEIRGLFMQAILNRQGEKYVNPEPLRKIYQIILKLPARQQFQGFLASSGCSDKLSVSETFLYLQKFMQIHPLRTTQIEFEKSIEDFYYRHQRQYLQGIKRWAKPALQKFANYVRAHGMDLGYFRGVAENSADPFAARLMLTFCTRERIQQYFSEVVAPANRELDDFTDEEIDLVLNELDPYNTGVIQINHIQRLFIEEINFHTQVTQNKPNTLLTKLRSKAFPAKRITLQKALASADLEGDGYINKAQFVEAVYECDVHILRDELEFIFDVMSEQYVKPTVTLAGLQEEDEAPTAPSEQESEIDPAAEKYLFLPFFFNKLFHEVEMRDINEIDGTLNLIKAALIYKGIDFGVIFAENNLDEDDKKKGRGRRNVKSQKPQGFVDVSNHYTRFAQQLVKTEFISRVMQLNAQNVTEVQASRLANYLALNQKNQSIIYLNSWLHHLRRVQTSFHIADRTVLPVICSKLLRNETYFRSSLEGIGMLKSKREAEKYIDLADLRSVLSKFYVNYVNQGLFLQEFTRKGQVHIEDLVVRMKQCVNSAYSGDAGAVDLPGGEMQGAAIDLNAIKAQNFFNKTANKIRLNKERIDLNDLMRKMQTYDISETNQIPAYILINVLKHNYGDIFDEETLIGLQFELECMQYDNCVDYAEFIKIIFSEVEEASARGHKRMSLNVKGDIMIQRNVANGQRYEELLGKISDHVKSQDQSLLRIFEIFCKATGFIEFDQFKKILSLLEFKIAEPDFKFLCSYADENAQGNLHAYDLVDQINFAQQIAPEFNGEKWKQAVGGIIPFNRRGLLELTQQHMLDLEEYMSENHSYTIRPNAAKVDLDGEQQEGEQVKKHQSSVLTGAQFQTMLRYEIPNISEHDVQLITKFAVKGSRRLPDQVEEPHRINKNIVLADEFVCDPINDVIQFHHFRRAVPEVISMMTSAAQAQSLEMMDNMLDEKSDANLQATHDRAQRKQKAEQEDQRNAAARKQQVTAMSNEQISREDKLISKITSVFVQRECTFYDAFKEVYDPLAKKNKIPIKLFKEKVQKLNLPLTVQDHRILRRIAQDPETIGQVDLKRFCPRFETLHLRRMRLNKTLDKLATAFYLQSLNLKRAFEIFDVSGNGTINRREFRQGFNQLNLGLTFDEIDDLMSMMSSDPSAANEVSYDDFIQHLDDNIRKRSYALKENVEESIMARIKECLDYAGETLYESLKIYDLEDLNTINLSDLPRVFKRLGISNIDPHIPYLLRIGQVLDPRQQRIDIANFSKAVTDEITDSLARNKDALKQVLNKVHSLFKAKDLSLFDLFIRLDKNGSGRLDKIELTSGILQMGMTLTRQEFELLWMAMHKYAKLAKHSGAEDPMKSRNQRGIIKSQQPRNRTPVGTVSYTDMIKAFVKAGCIQIKHSIDRSSTLMTKMRQQMKRLGLSAEKAYKSYDPEDHRFVFRNEFMVVSEMLGLEFSEEELNKIFDQICTEGTIQTESNNQQDQAIDRLTHSNLTRFNQKQFLDSIQVKRGEDWVNQSYIKIHQVVLQKGLSYKRLFNQWREAKSKSGKFRLSAGELHGGLKKLKAGLTADEINKLCNNLPYAPKDNTISAEELQQLVIEGAEKLKNESSFQKAMLVSWINQFNIQMETNSYPMETLFSEFDTEHKGGLAYENWCNLNEFVGVSMSKIDLKKVFKLIDRQENGFVRIDEVRAIIAMSARPDADDDEEKGMQDIDSLPEGNENLKGNELLVRQQVNDVYEEIKNAILDKNVTFDHILFTDLNYLPVQLATETGFKQACEKLGIRVNPIEAKRVLSDLRHANNGKVECTYKHLVDFMTKNRINVAMLDKGFVDPLLASSITQLQLVQEYYNLSNAKMFGVFDPDQSGDITKAEFMMNIQGMEMTLSLEDILELFNFMDDKSINRITRTQFVDSMTFLQNKIGGTNLLESSAAGKAVMATRKGVPNTQFVFGVLGDICDALQKKKYNIGQLLSAMDVNKTGYNSRAEFTNIVNQMAENVPLESVRKVVSFLDHTGTGKVSIVEFLRLCQELLNQKIGGGVFLTMQAIPIIRNIINQLAIDCDKFFDEVAESNQSFLKMKERQFQDEFSKQPATGKQSFGKDVDAKSASEYRLMLKYKTKSQDNSSNVEMGLGKSIFFNSLSEYGVSLTEQEKSIISSVYSMQGRNTSDMLDYEKLDLAFEGIQQQLYNQNTMYTKEWERRVFKRIGRYLMRNNTTMHEMFKLIGNDDEGKVTVNVHEIELALARFNLQIGNAGIKVFMERINPQGKKQLTQNEFISRFWSAYTYDENFDDNKEAELDELKENSSKNSGPIKSNELGNIKIPKPAQLEIGSHKLTKARAKIVSEYDQQLKMLKVFRAIQHSIKKIMTVQEAFTKLDSGKVGFLTLQNFQANFSRYFDLSLKKDEVRQLFREIDNDGNGVVQYAEFERFIGMDFIQRTIEQEQEKEHRSTQNEIFDHLLKMIHQRGLTLSEVFDQIDSDKNNFIEIEEFHDLLEQMGFTITKGQVYELMRQMDDNFDGRISYAEMNDYMKTLGFDVDKLEGRDERVLTQKARDHEREATEKEFVWRDKALEIIIRAVNRMISAEREKNKDKSTKKPVGIIPYFEKYDEDMDAHLTPSQFRLAMLDLDEPQLKKSQVDRVMHILLDSKKQQPLIAIERIQRLLLNYKYLEIGEGKGSQSVLIDEDLFVYIVEKYDGLSRLMELTIGGEDRASYLARHVNDVGLRGLHMMSNQKTIERLEKKAGDLRELHQSTFVLLSTEVSRLIKDEAVMVCLDPTYNIDSIVSDHNIGLLQSISLPQIENTQFDIDYKDVTILPCGAQRYLGMLMETKQTVEIIVYPNDTLQYPSADGKAFKKHLALEMQLHRYMMGVRFEEDNDAENDEASADIFGCIGTFEKRMGLSISDKDIYQINRHIDKDEWICLDEFVYQNGGILNIPMFYHTDAPLYIIRHWAKLILQIISKVHDVSIVLRCLNTKQLYISRDGQRVRLGHTRGIGRVNNFGFVQQAPDIFLNLDNNNVFNIDRQSSTNFSPSKGNANTSSRRTDGGQKCFSNQALDVEFLAPELLFSKFQDHTSAIDVWGFGMVLYCVLFGKKPKSFYAVYRDWYKKTHNRDVGMGTIPFVPPSTKNFIYDPFAFDFENPFDAHSASEDPDLGAEVMKQLKGLAEAAEADADMKNEKLGDGMFDFSNFMKCISKLSYSALFSDDSSKFNCKNLSYLADKAQENSVPRFAGQEVSNNQSRMQTYMSLAQQEVLARKNELGLILDVISSCLEMDPKKRPSIQGLLHSPLFSLDNFEAQNAVRFSQSVILYRSPISSVSMRITAPLRQICADVLQSPMSIYGHEEAIMQLFAYTEDCVAHITNMPIQEINSVLSQKEKRRGLVNRSLNTTLKTRDTSDWRVSPNSPLAAQVVEDHVVDMLLFLTFRYLKNFEAYKAKRIAEVQKFTEQLSANSKANETMSQMEGVRFDNSPSKVSQTVMSSMMPGGTEGQTASSTIDKKAVLKMQAKRKQNHVLDSMTRLLKTMVYEMYSYSTPMSPYAAEVLSYIVKFFTGEEYSFGSDVVLVKSRREHGAEETLKEFLGERSFFRKEDDLKEDFKTDKLDKLWYLDQKNKDFLDKSNYWCLELHHEAIKIYRDAITESGLGQSCYPVLNDYIQSVSNSFEPSKIFSRQMNQLSLSFLVPMNRTQQYYNELVPITESLARLQQKQLDTAGKRCSLAMIRSVFQTGNADKIKACLDMRVPKHIIHFLQDSDQQVRAETLLALFEISKGLQDEDFEIMTKNAVNIKQEYNKQGFQNTAFDKHKAVSMASQQEVLDVDPNAAMESGQGGKRGRQAKQNQEPMQSNVDQMAAYIKRTIALIEKNENEKYINFALDLPNLNFLACKRFLAELAVCFESPVFIAPLIRLLKTPSETFANKKVILDIVRNLVCGNEKVLIALNSPACDTYMSLLKLLMKNSKSVSARASNLGMTSQVRHQLALQDKAIDLFKFMFEQRRPSIIRDLQCCGASGTLLGEQEMTIPKNITLPDLMCDFDGWDESWYSVKKVKCEKLIVRIKDLRCWIKHFYDMSTIPELTRTKALQRCMNFLIRTFQMLWQDYFKVAAPTPKSGMNKKGTFENVVGDATKAQDSLPSPAQKHNYIEVMRQVLHLFDWLCTQNRENFIFGEECGRANLAFVINTCNQVLSQFRQPVDTEGHATIEDLTYNNKGNKKVQKERKFDTFPLTDLGAILQNIEYQLVRLNKPHLNELLAEANFGFVLGEQLLLDYDFVRHCIDNCVESMVLLDTYVKKNEIRLNSLEYLLRSHEHTLKDQLLKSNFLEKVLMDYIRDFRAFNIQYSKIELEFLAFRKSFPLRLEAISIFNTILLYKDNAPQIYSELIMYARRHFLVRQEADMIQAGVRITNKEATALLLFAIILEANEHDLVYVMTQEGVPQRIHKLMKEYPSLNKRFPILSAYTTNIYSGTK